MSRLRPSAPLRSLACLRPANEQSPLRGEYRTVSLTRSHFVLPRVVLAPPVRGLPPSARQRLERPRILSATRSLPALRRMRVMASGFDAVIPALGGFAAGPLGPRGRVEVDR
jgi:hypothetical protein